MDVILKKLGQIIKNKRKSKEFSLNQLAELSGGTASQISRIENEKAALTLSAAVRLLHVLDISLADILEPQTIESMRLYFKNKSTGQIVSENLNYLNHNDIDLLDMSRALSSGKAGEMILILLEDFIGMFKNADMPWTSSELAHLFYNYLAVKELKSLPQDILSIKTANNFPKLEDFRYPKNISLDKLENIHLSNGTLILLDIGAYIRQSRYSRSLSLQALGDMVGFSNQGIRKLENQTPEKLRLEDVLRLDQALNLDGKLLSMAWETAKFYAGFYRTKTKTAGVLKPFQSFEIHGIEKLVVVSRLYQHYGAEADSDWLKKYRSHAQNAFSDLRK